MSDPDFLVDYHIKIGRDGSVHNDVDTLGNSFADVYRGIVAIRDEVLRQIADRRECPHNPAASSSPLPEAEAVMVWPPGLAPEDLRAQSPNNGDDLDWIAVVPRSFNGIVPDWLVASTSWVEHEHREDGSVLAFGFHA